MSEEQVFTFKDGDATMAQIAGLGFSKLAEVRSTAFAKGIYGWEIDDAGFEIRQATDKETNEQVDKLTVFFKLKCVDIRDILDDKVEDASMFLDKERQETFWINKVQEDLGRAKAFIVDSGFQVPPGIGDDFETILKSTIGHRFYGAIKTRPNKNDPDRPWIDLDLLGLGELQKKLAALGVGPLAAGAAPAAQPAQQGAFGGAAG